MSRICPTCGFCKFAYIKAKFNAKTYATRDMHFARLMFKAELINFKIWDFYSFAKVAVIKLWQMSELNFYK